MCHQNFDCLSDHLYKEEILTKFKEILIQIEFKSKETKFIFDKTKEEITSHLNFSKIKLDGPYVNLVTDVSLLENTIDFSHFFHNSFSIVVEMLLITLNRMNEEVTNKIEGNLLVKMQEEKNFILEFKHLSQYKSDLEEINKKLKNFKILSLEIGFLRNIYNKVISDKTSSSKVMKVAHIYNCYFNMLFDLIDDNNLKQTMKYEYYTHLNKIKAIVDLASNEFSVELISEREVLIELSSNTMPLFYLDLQNITNSINPSILLFKNCIYISGGSVNNLEDNSFYCYNVKTQTITSLEGMEFGNINHTMIGYSNLERDLIIFIGGNHTKDAFCIRSGIIDITKFVLFRQI
jgi:hypothetical protein